MSMLDTNSTAILAALQWREMITLAVSIWLLVAWSVCLTGSTHTVGMISVEFVISLLWSIFGIDIERLL